MAKFENPGGVANRIYADDETILEGEARLNQLPFLSLVQLEALQQMAQPVWDGNLISKAARSELCDMRLAFHWNGLNFLTQEDYCVLSELKMLGDTTKFCGGLPKKHRRAQRGG